MVFLKEYLEKGYVEKYLQKTKYHEITQHAKCSQTSQPVRVNVNQHAHRPILLNQPLLYKEGLLFMDFNSVTLTSQEPSQHNNKFDCSKTNGCNIPQYVVKKEDAIAIFYEEKNFIYPADTTFRIIRIIDFNRAEPTCYRTNFHCAISGEQNGAFWYIVLRIMLLTYTRAMIGFSNCGRLS